MLESAEMVRRYLVLVVLAGSTSVGAQPEHVVFCWSESREDSALDCNIPEVFDGDSADPRAADAVFLEELRRAAVPIDFYYRTQLYFPDWFAKYKQGGETPTEP